MIKTPSWSFSPPPARRGRGRGSAAVQPSVHVLPAVRLARAVARVARAPAVRVQRGESHPVLPAHGAAPGPSARRQVRAASAELKCADVKQQRKMIYLEVRPDALHD